MPNNPIAHLENIVITCNFRDNDTVHTPKNIKATEARTRGDADTFYLGGRIAFHIYQPVLYQTVLYQSGTGYAIIEDFSRD